MRINVKLDVYEVTSNYVSVGSVLTSTFGLTITE